MPLCGRINVPQGLVVLSAIQEINGGLLIFKGKKVAPGGRKRQSFCKPLALKAYPEFQRSYEGFANV